MLRSLVRLLALFCLVVLAGFAGGCVSDATSPQDAGAARDARADDVSSRDGPLGRCTRDPDCSDGTFCNGVERCLPADPGADARGCVAPAMVACLTGQTCDEARDTCLTDCTGGGDQDRDGHRAANCGGDDCNDADPQRYPGRMEVCDATDHDEDCDPLTHGQRDMDRDGFDDNRCCNVGAMGARTCGEDCDDARRNVNPLTTEVCDGVDNDCDGRVDEGVSVPGFDDRDRDRHGDPMRPRNACPGAVGFATLGDDCDDTNASRHPGHVEVCDRVDNDCNGVVDDNARAVTWYLDGDRDGYGSARGGTMVSCEPVPGHSLLPGDCDDTQASVNPVATELCNGRDDDCNGMADFQVGPGDFEDDDGDQAPDLRCPMGGTDCDDRDPRRAPGATEICDGVDNNCDGRVDEGTMAVAWYTDRDGDGYGSPIMPRMSCEPLAGRVTRGGDCDDNDPARHPGAVDRCNEVDDDCDGMTDEDSTTVAYYRDRDGDRYGAGMAVLRCGPLLGYTTDTGDCDDADSARHPGSVETCNGLDDDCDGMTDEAPLAAASCPSRGNAVTECTGGRCGFACSRGYGDCDGDRSNGCETETLSNSANCGLCGRSCAGAGTCLSGMCACGAGQALCRGSCRDLMTDSAHCGSCDNACPAGTVCSGGACRCPTGQALCGGRCVYTSIDVSHCGACGMACIAGQTCLAGRCVALPGGDACAMPAPLVFTDGRATVRDDTTTAGHDPAMTTCEGPGAGDVFYGFTLTRLQTVVATVDATGWRPAMWIRRTACAGSDLACSNPFSGTTFVGTSLPAGSYVLGVGGRTTFDRGAFRLDVQTADPLAGDNCAAAAPITFVGGTAALRADLALATPDSAGPFGATPQRDLFFRLTVGSDSNLSVRASAVGTGSTVTLLRTCIGTTAIQSVSGRTASLRTILAAGTYILAISSADTGISQPFMADVTLRTLSPGDQCQQPLVYSAVMGSFVSGTTAGFAPSGPRV